MKWAEDVIYTGEECIQSFGWENLKDRDHKENLGIDGRIIIKMVLKQAGCEGVDRIHLAEDEDKWQALVNMAVNLQVAQNAGNFLVGFSRRTQLDGIS
jgi:hypothetical protein